MLEIKTFGNLIITKDGKSLDTLDSLRAKVLLTYLALEGGSHHRNYLAAMFWPESPEEKALSSLRVVLSELRKAAGEYLNINRTDVSTLKEKPIKLDVFEFENSLRAGNLDRVLAIYRGDFLAGIYIPGSIEFENWRRWESERIRHLIVEHLENRIRNKIGLGDYREAAEFSRHLLKIDPMNETGHLNYSISLAMSDNRSAAIDQIKSFRKTLSVELGMEPSIDFNDIQQWISSGDLKSLKHKIKPRTNLPMQQTNFVGREEAIEQVTELITGPKCRHLSIIGPGGIGKTRLAQKCIESNFQHFPDGSFFVPLESVTSGEGIYQAIAEAMDFKFDSIVNLISPQHQLADVIGDQNILFLFDGFEHLTASGNILSSILNNSPNIKIIVTSRHKLNISCEWVFTLDGMKISDSNIVSSSNLPEAQELFLHRAEQNNPGLEISDEDIISISRICTLVEGLPLGIELAAGWSSILNFSDIANEISTSYEFLDRQIETSTKYKKIKSVFASSWNLLDRPHQIVMARLSVFQGGFSHQAAKLITGATLTDLSTLIDKSMLRKNQRGKFEIHPVIQEFCQEIIRDLPHEWDDIQKKHYLYFADYLSIRVPDMFILGTDCTHLEIKNELLNIHAAAEYAAIFVDDNQEIELIKNLYSYYIIHGWYEGALVFDRIAELLKEKQLECRDKNILKIAQIQAQKGFFYSNLGLIEESEVICRTSLPILEKSKKFRELAICIQNLGINAIFRGEYNLASNLLDKAISISKNTSCSCFPSFYLWVGYLHFMLGTYQEGMDSLIISLDLFKKDNNDRGTAFSLSKMGLAQDGLGNHEKASRYHEKALKIFQDSENKAGQGYALTRMSLGALLLADYQTALEYGKEALAEFSEIGHRWGKCASLSRIAYAKMGLGELAEAKEFFLEALTIAHEHKLDPLCLHAMAGIACLKALEGSKKEAQGLMEYVQRHPKTPEIYMAVHEIWLKIDKKRKYQKTNKGLDPDLGIIVEQILEGEN